MSAIQFNARRCSIRLAFALLLPVSSVAAKPVLEEVIVTAQKREQSVQDVPMSVSVVQGEVLNELKMFNFEELRLVTTGLDLRAIDGRAGSIALRGIDYNPNSAASQAVDLYWNGTTLGTNASGGVFQQMFDIGRVEVLRGPQGALQGRTSPAGAIAIHTRMPDPGAGYGGVVQATVTDNSGINTQGAVNIPLVREKLAARIAVVYDTSNLDEIENVLGGGDSESETTASRLSLRWYPTDTLSTDLIWQYLENDIDTHIITAGTSTLDQGLPVLDPEDRQGINPEVDRFEGEYNYVALNLNWEILGHQLTYVGGYSDLDSTRDFDGASGNSKVGFDPVDVTPEFPQVGATDSMLDSPQRFVDENETWSHELRFSSLGGERVQYIFGLYYAEEDAIFQREFMRDLPAGPGQSLFFNMIAPVPFEVEDIAVFTHFDVRLTEALSLQLGGRWQERDLMASSNAFTTEDLLFPSGLVTEAGTVLLELLTPEEGGFKDDKVTGSLSLQYDFVGHDSVGYLSVATGWRPGGVNVSAQDLREFQVFEEENSVAYELGLKSELLEGRLRVNTALFYQEFDDYIGRFPRIPTNRDGNPRPDGSPRGSASLTANGDATVTGIEIEVDYLVSEHWRAGGGLSYVEAEYDDASLPCNDGNIPAGEILNTCNSDGMTLGPQSPLSIRLSSEYSLPFEHFEGYVRGHYQFNDERDDPDAADGKLDDYWLFDLHLGLRGAANARWDVSLFARNLFDENGVTAIQPQFRDFTGVGTGYQRVVVLPQRRLGLSARYRF